MTVPIDSRSAVKPTPSQITVAIADDHAIMRDGLRMILGAHSGVEVVAEASDLAGTFDTVARAKPQILLLDVNLGEESSLETVARLRSEYPDTAVIILTMQKNPEDARRALADGASGYVLKEAAGRELVRAIEVVAAGGSYVQPELGAELVRQRVKRNDEPLTRREREVLGLIGLGHTNREIAAKLCISVRTVESHRARIQEKLELAGRAQLMRYAHDHGLTRF